MLKWLTRGLLEKFEKDEKCSELMKSYVKSQVYNCKEITKRSLNVNSDLCSHLGKMNDADMISIVILEMGTCLRN